MKCPHCGALNARVNGQLASNCWLCGRSLSGESQPTGTVPAPPVPSVATVNPRRKYARSFTLASIFLATTLIAVCLGVIVAAPGLGIVLAIFCLPAFVRTGLVVQRRAALGKTVSTAEKIGWFMGSAATTVVVAVVVAVAAVGTFCAVCVGAAEAGAMGTTGEGTFWVVIASLIVAAAVAVPASILMVRWIRRRWRRDIERR
jgi:hypothetical protein